MGLFRLSLPEADYPTKLSYSRCVTTMFKPSLLITAPACARPDLPEMTRPGPSSLDCWAPQVRRNNARHGTEGGLRGRRGPDQERHPPAQVPHRARHRDQLG